MDEFLKMDVFFVVATAAVVVLACFVAYALYWVIRILRNVEHISKQAALESDHLREDLAELREDLREGKGRIESMFSLLTRVGRRRTK